MSRKKNLIHKAKSLSSNTRKNIIGSLLIILFFGGLIWISYSYINNSSIQKNFIKNNWKQITDRNKLFVIKFNNYVDNQNLNDLSILSDTYRDSLIADIEAAKKNNKTIGNNFYQLKYNNLLDKLLDYSLSLNNIIDNFNKANSEDFNKIKILAQDYRNTELETKLTLRFIEPEIDPGYLKLFDKTQAIKDSYNNALSDIDNANKQKEQKIENQTKEQLEVKALVKKNLESLISNNKDEYISTLSKDFATILDTEFIFGAWHNNAPPISYKIASISKEGDTYKADVNIIYRFITFGRPPTGTIDDTNSQVLVKNQGTFTNTIIYDIVYDKDNKKWLINNQRAKL